MAAQNLRAMEGGVPFSPKHKAFADNEGGVARVSVDIESLELGEATPQAMTLGLAKQLKEDFERFPTVDSMDGQLVGAAGTGDCSG